MGKISFKWAHVGLAVAMMLLFALKLFAQDGGLDVDINVNKDPWYGKPWVWIVGGAVFVLLLVALLRSGKRN
ncbi:MAG TPA: hypothetical protein VD993_04765 [Chitinophagaceae bacterium]|nr:hypothetical protein [Chitinophagaceae bacterium]